MNPLDHEIIFVFAKTKRVGYEFMDKLIEKIPYGEVSKVIKNPMTYKVILKNKTEYQFCFPSDRTRGYRYSKVYIQKGLDDETMTLIGFCLCPDPDLPTNEVIMFFD